MTLTTEYTFCWEKKEKHFSESFPNFLDNKAFVDVTLFAEEQHFEVHRVILSAASPYFHAMFLESSAASGKSKINTEQK